MDSILDGLNPAQYTAVTSPAAVLQILAPPGSGKTKTLTSRVAHLLRYDGFKPWEILCLTFTIKSAREMKERLNRILGDGAESRLVLGTFHSVCRRYLASYGHLIGIRKGFGIADSSDTISIIKRIIKRLKLNIDPRAAQSRISSSKARGIRHTDIALTAAKSKKLDQQEFFTVFKAYESHLSISNLLDYDDLLLRCVDLIRRHPQCVANVKIVLVDEFQDTNIIQFDLMLLFATKHQRITTVGDPDQSIYGWRSAEIKNLKRMQQIYTDTLVIHLENTYRSSGAILMAADAVIKQDQSRHSKPLSSTHCLGSLPVLRRIPSAEAEASWLVSEIKRTMNLTAGLLRSSDFAVLLRSAALSRHIESALGTEGIAYRMVGGQRFFDRIEIKILLDYLRVVSLPDNNEALARIINVPSRSIGVMTLKHLLEEAESMNITLWSLVQDVVQGNRVPRTKISKSAEQGMGVLISIILTARKSMVDNANPSSPMMLLQFVVKKLKFQEYLKKHYEQDHEARWANVEELIAQASESSDLSKFDDCDSDVLPHVNDVDQMSGSAAEEALSKFLANVALATELQREDDCSGEVGQQGRVTISTIHAAKGLEWPVVFIPSAYEGCIPHSRAEDTDEERRLLYVAMTRAQALLYMSCPVKNSQREETVLSSFLSEKTLGRYLVKKGPTLDFDTVYDISQILRRICPSQEDMIEAVRSIGNIADDLWPLDGQEDPESKYSTWSIRYNEESHTASEPSRKRCKYNAAPEIRNKPHLLNQPLSNLSGTEWTSLPTTMQSQASFSLPKSGGFMSASVQLQQSLAKQALGLDMAATKRKVVSSSTSLEAELRTGKVSRGQDSLLTYWKLENPQEAKRQSAAKMSPTYSSEANSLSARSTRASGNEELSMSTNTSRRATASLGLPKPATDDTRALHSRHPLFDIPQSLANHKLSPAIGCLRPPKLFVEDETGEQQYGFLSSSPPSSEDIRDTETARFTEPVQPLIRGDVTSSHVNGNDTCKHNVRSASTSHNASVAQVRAMSQTVKKTLGLRRDMVGWSARGDQSHGKLIKGGNTIGSCLTEAASGVSKQES